MNADAAIFLVKVFHTAVFLFASGCILSSLRHHRPRVTEIASHRYRRTLDHRHSLVAQRAGMPAVQHHLSLVRRPRFQ